LSAEAGRAPAAYEVTGPSAFTGDFRRFLNLTRILAVTEWKLRFFDSALGYLWTLMRPALFFGVLYVVFSLIVDVGDDVAHYPSLLLTGMVIFFFFQESTSAAVTAVVDNENLVRKIHFPRMAIPMSVVLTATFALCLNLVVLLGMVLINRVTPRISWLELIPVLGILIVFSIGVASILSALYVRARDLAPIWDVATQALFYLTPVLFPIQLVITRSSETVAHLLMLNPLAALIQQARHAIVGPSQPTAAAAIGGAPRLLIPLAIVLVTFALGIWVFQRMAPRIAEEL
jgi:ABC-2 type transport system permease protein